MHSRCLLRLRSQQNRISLAKPLRSARVLLLWGCSHARGHQVTLTVPVDRWPHIPLGSLDRCESLLITAIIPVVTNDSLANANFSCSQMKIAWNHSLATGETMHTTLSRISFFWFTIWGTRNWEGGYSPPELLITQKSNFVDLARNENPQITSKH